MSKLAPACVPVLVALGAAPAGAAPCPPGTTLRHGRWQDECLEADGTRHGPYLVLNDAGRPQDAGRYVHGKKEGRWVSWHDNGKPSHVCSYHEDVEHGLCVSYDENGTKRREESYRHGDYVGRMVEWDASGNEIYACEWSEDGSCSPSLWYVMGVSFQEPGGVQFALPGTIGGGVVGTREDLAGGGGFTMGLRPGVMFMMNKLIGVGTNLEVLTMTGFADAQVGGGLSFRLGGPVAFALTGGPYARHTEEWGWEPGVGVGLTGGIRMPPEEFVELPAGLRLDFRYGLGEAHEVAWLLSLEIDVIYPFVPLWLMANADWGY